MPSSSTTRATATHTMPAGHTPADGHMVARHKICAAAWESLTKCEHKHLWQWLWHRAGERFGTGLEIKLPAVAAVLGFAQSRTAGQVLELLEQAGLVQVLRRRPGTWTISMNEPRTSAALDAADGHTPAAGHKHQLGVSAGGPEAEPHVCAPARKLRAGAQNTHIDIKRSALLEHSHSQQEAPQELPLSFDSGGCAPARNDFDAVLGGLPAVDLTARRTAAERFAGWLIDQVDGYHTEMAEQIGWLVVDGDLPQREVEQIVSRSTRRGVSSPAGYVTSAIAKQCARRGLTVPWARRRA